MHAGMPNAAQDDGDLLCSVTAGSPATHPRQPAAEPQESLFRGRLEKRGGPADALMRPAGLVDWERFETGFGLPCTDSGRPGLTARVMVGLQLIKQMDTLSDDLDCVACRSHTDRISHLSHPPQMGLCGPAVPALVKCRMGKSQAPLPGQHRPRASQQWFH
jgi:IS5 family transposase